MSTETFFDEPTQQSQVKSTIVSKYFGAWSKIMVSVLRRNADKRIAYIDLFAGPGQYSDRTDSTPLLVLKQAIQDKDLRQHLATMFNDKDERNAELLRKAIENLPGVETLRHQPQVIRHEVGNEIVEQFETVRFVPTLFFVDPWGYKGLSLRLVNSVIKDWGCDCIFFFNYNRINMGLPNDAVREHMNDLFGSEERADKLRRKLDTLGSPQERELTIIEELCQTIRDTGPQFVLPFRFKNDSGGRTGHHLIFISKDFKGYEIMKDIMAKESSDRPQGVASFEYNPASDRQPFLFEYSRPLDDLEDMILKEFAGKRLKMIDIYKEHSVNKSFVKSNYKKALLQLEAQGKITASPHRHKRRRDTFAEHVWVTFP